MNTATALVSFGKKILKIRNSKGLSQSELSSKIGVSQVTAQRIESGLLAGLRVETFIQLALSLDMSISDLFFEIEKNLSLAESSPHSITQYKKCSSIKPSKKSQIAKIILKLLEKPPAV